MNVPELEQVTHLPEAVVEHAIKIIMMQNAYPQHTTRTLLNHVEHSIRAAIQASLNDNVLNLFYPLFLVFPPSWDLFLLL